MSNAESAREDAPRALVSSLGDYRNVAAIVAGLGILQAGTSALGAFAPLTLLARGESAMGVAIVSASYAAGFLIGALRATASVRAIGHIRAFAGFAAAATIFVLALYQFAHLWAWMAVQACIGICVAALLTTGESWIADVAPRERRGAIVSFYLVISKVGQILGPIALIGMAPAHPSAFMAIGAALAGSLIPVCATRRTQPQAPSVQPFGVREAWATAPAAVLASFAAGAVNGSVLQLYPLYAVEDVATANFFRTASLNAALALGALVAQWPAGWISDRRDRRVVIAALAALGAGVALALGLLRDSAPWAALLALAALWGAG
ncbi:MAG: MFS transporter, partial [Hyphomonadaceae bacterium]